MGRYYEISVSTGTTPNPGTTAIVPVTPTSLYYSSNPNGVYDPNALQVEMDLLSSVMAIPMGNCTITVHGVSLATLQAASVFTGASIVVKGGMLGGLPLAQSIQTKSGLLLQGQIFQSWGNWIGNEMNLNFMVVPSSFTFDQPGNIVFNWQQGQSIAQTLTQTLSTAYGKAPTIQLGGSYAPHGGIQPNAAYQNLTMFGQWLKQYTASDSSEGIDITAQADGSILVFDGLATPSPIQIQFTDLIGQPKWVDVETMQMQTVMRADIQVGNLLTMPSGFSGAPGWVTQTGSAFPGPLKYQSAFQGNFVVQSVRHIGNYRDPDGSSWASLFQVVPQVVSQ